MKSVWWKQQEFEKQVDALCSQYDGKNDKHLEIKRE